MGLLALKKETSGAKRERRVMNIEEASRVGVLYYLHDEPTYRTVSEYVGQLQGAGKTVKALGYVESKRLTGQFLPKLSYDFLYPSGLSWNYKPVSTAAKDFIESKFDILIDLSTEDYLPLLFISGKSKAVFKAGMQSERRKPFLDLMIDLRGNNGLHELIKQMNHYLSIINRPNES